jgi:hypothetical protein
MNKCKKCGNPEQMFWCAECCESSEVHTCDNCNSPMTLDPEYHDNCTGTEEETDILG